MDILKKQVSIQSTQATQATQTGNIYLTDNPCKQVDKPTTGEQHRSIIEKQEYKTLIYNKNNSSDTILYNISKFVEKNYSDNLLSSIPINLPVSSIKKYFNIESEIEILYNTKNLLGVNLAFYLPVDIKSSLNKTFHIEYPDNLKSLCYKDSIIIEYSNYVVIDKRYRKKNLANFLLHSGIKNLYNNGILLFMGNHNKARTENPVIFNTWYFPLNYDKLDKIEYIYPKNYKSLFNLINDVSSIKEINENNIIKAYDFYINSTENKFFAFKPSFILWKKWIKTFDTYIVENNQNVIIGLFSYDIIETHNQRHNVIVNKSKLLLCIGEQPETLKYSIVKSRINSDILFINELGDLTENILKKIYAQRLTKRFLNIYNTPIVLQPNDVYVPIF